MSPGAGWWPPEGAVPLRRIRELRAGATSTRCRLRGKVPGTGLYCPFSWNGVYQEKSAPVGPQLPRMEIRYNLPTRSNGLEPNPRIWRASFDQPFAYRVGKK